ncbi:MAG TPA: acyl-CoA dehydrogenase family protein [Candidatus Binatia bacterium]
MPRGAPHASPLDAARALAGEIAAAAETIERERRVPEPLIREMARAGLFRMLVPRELGGLEVEPRTMVDAIEEVARVVDAMYEAGGVTSIYSSSALQRRFRDVHVVTQHILVAPPTYELAGRVLLGLPADTEML